MVKNNNFFLKVSLNDFKERNRDYHGIAIAFSGMSPQQEQEFYIIDLNSRIRTLKAWKGEMELIIETSKDSSKIEGIKEQIVEKELESKRREKVVETKFYGAVMELLDLQRNMLKDKEGNTKSLITLQKDVQELKESVNKILKEVAQIVSK